MIKLITIFIFFVIMIIFIFPISFFINSKPYIKNGILYLELKTIPIKDIIQIEIKKDPILYVVIHTKSGIYSLPYDKYIQIIKDLWIK